MNYRKKSVRLGFSPLFGGFLFVFAIAYIILFIFII